MFRETPKNQQTSLFGDIPILLGTDTVKQTLYNDVNGWHNQFRKNIYNKIEEKPYNVLFSDSMGAPNASIALLNSMMILKELFRWSDAQLFEQAQFNLLVRSALGLFNINDPLPTPSTYYLFRQRLNDYAEESGIDLYYQTFVDVTGKQVREFNVNGQRIRMDSKLIGSHIAWYSRYELIHKTVQLFYGKLDQKEKLRLEDTARHSLEDLIKEAAEKIVYHNTRTELKSRLLILGQLIYLLLAVFQDHPGKEYKQLVRLFREQYKVTDGEKIEVRPRKEIASGSLQSPYDPDCSYRRKGDQKVKGYSVNVTETCSETGLNLITDVQVAGANTADTGFMQKAVGQSEKLLGQKVKNIHSDGAYYSKDNADYSKEEEKDFVNTGIQGVESRYDLKLQDGCLQVCDRHSGDVFTAKQAGTQRGNDTARWYIVTGQGRKYFDQRAIVSSESRRILKNRSTAELNIRNNVESTIFHFSYGLIKGKTAYRGKYKQELWAYGRAMAVNLIRIVKYLRSKEWDEVQIAKNTAPVSPIVTTARLIFSIFLCLRYLMNKMTPKLIFQPNFIISVN